MLKALQWTDEYLTGIASVDEQHAQLVELINRLGEAIVEGDTCFMQDCYKALVSYAARHFADEERWMVQQGVELQALEQHRQLHQRFVRELRQLRGEAQASQARMEQLHDFLLSWVIYHILAEDRPLLSALADGPPAAVSAQLLTVLLDTVHNLYQALSGMNAGLEQQVGQRTAELRASNARLQAEQQALSQTLRELADTQAQLLLNQKMAAVGQLAAGIAHEVNNPVGFVRSNLVTLDEYSHNLLALVDGYRTLHLGLNLDAQQLNRLRLLEEEYELDYIRDDLPALFSESLQGVERVRKIVRQLLGYSRAEDEQLAELNLNQTLQELLSLLRAGLPENLQVDCQWGEVPMCLARTAEIGQIFSNIFFNAVQAVEQQALPRIVIATGYVDDDLWFAVSDNGCGMSAEQQSRVFEPFFSTRAQGQGNGLGMTVVWNLLARYQGRIAIDSSPQQGTCVRVCLPQRPA